jgi:hypothetical protein
MWLRGEFYDLKLDISHLVVNGCSYTYGHGIENPIDNAWPSLVAKKLGVPVINLAIPGQSNYAVQDRTFKYFFKDLYNDNNPFYIHAYTQSLRRDVYLAKDHMDHDYQDYVLLDWSNHGKITRVEKEIILQTDDYCYCLLEEKKYHIWHSINNLLDIHNINHLSTDYMMNTDGSVKEWMRKHHYILTSEIASHPSKLLNFNLLTKDISKTPCLHETEEGHYVIADYIYKQIQKRYSKINVVDKPFAKLEDIYVEPPAIAKLKKTAHHLKEHQHRYYAWSQNIYYLTEIGYDYRLTDWLGKPLSGNKP